MMGPYLVIWCAGFAGILAIIGILQMVKVMDGEATAPPHVWKWFVLLSAVWPIFAVVFLLVGLINVLFPRFLHVPRRPPNQPFMANKTYAFTVRARNENWDCYHFASSDGKPGTLGFTKREGNFVIGLMCAGHLTEAEAQKQLDEALKKEVG